MRAKPDRFRTSRPVVGEPVILIRRPDDLRRQALSEGAIELEGLMAAYERLGEIVLDRVVDRLLGRFGSVGQASRLPE
ncbi:MAG: hypothetical protein JJU36_04780 [Phycisphaeraceae bacterium]|nr:hypothetical protein [Phycisphaeraceae bacterium]